ncbi:hypothetical protein OAU52_01295, partial [bacterium]|nr:hypothetical protein [bacterium]
SDSCGNKVVKRISLDISSRPTPPKINSAWIYDTDGDGKGDQIHIEGYDNLPDSNAIPFDSFDSLSYSWPELNNSFSVSKSDISLTGKMIVLNNKTLDASSDKIQGSIKIEYTQGTSILASIFKDGISDSIGPVIRFASIQEKSTSSELDSLKVHFSREVSQIDLEIMYSYFEFHSGIKVTQDQIVQQDEKRFIFVYPSGTINAGDSVKIRPLQQSQLIAKFNNRSAAANNQKVEIILDQGTIAVSNTGNEFHDKDGDGRLDLIQLSLARPVDEERLSQMRIRFNWIANDFEKLSEITEFDISASTCKSDDGVTLSCTLSDTAKFGKLITYFTPGSWGDLWLSQPDFQSETGILEQQVEMRDAMGPIILNATLIKSSNPDKKNEKMNFNFTEPILTELVNNNQLFDYLIEKNIESYRHSSELIWKSQQTAARVTIEPSMERPSIGDFVRVRSVSGEPNLIQDLAGNLGHPQNPWVPIEGKQVIQFFFNEIATVPEDSYLEEETFTDIIFFEKGENFSEKLSENENLGAGFSFSFKDSSTSISERKKVFISYKLSIYDQLGQFVANKSSEFNCTDLEDYMKKHNSLSDLAEACNPAIVGASREIRSFIPWNFRSHGGRLVGAGTYLININALSQKESLILYSREETQKRVGVNR